MITHVPVTCYVAAFETALYATHQPSVSSRRSSLGVTTITGLQLVTGTLPASGAGMMR